MYHLITDGSPAGYKCDKCNIRYDFRYNKFEILKTTPDGSPLWVNWDDEDS